ncbi:Cyclopiazonic acid biosynthesis cluster T [Hyphodiscus hymeniophilus]|uniref:Cyclopiazonic acid biosynthesis cluster T n=1 Tax=Hyphodiscus hymeniophilus TaxID=353542 RepID=A0A9P6VJK0_9HELO|nr:Cyclopiazonic acid biosynthesis cluster T [Hyphodiscus hymeniophilus]
MTSQSKNSLEIPSSKTSSLAAANLPDVEATLPQETKAPTLSNQVPEVLDAGEALPDEKSRPSKVSWENDNDPQNPMKWNSSLRWQNLGLISAMSLVTPLSSTMFAPSVPLLPAHFHLSTTTSTLVVSIFVLGFAVGPLIIAPLSEIYGRRPAYVASIFLFLVFSICCAVSNSLPMLIVFRLLAGSVGSTSITISGATVGDLMPPAKRGGYMALMAMGPLLGPVLGPIIGGYLGDAEGWRWIFWLQSIIAGLLFLLGLVFLKETYPVIILERKAAALRKETGNPNLISALHDGLAPRQRIKNAIARPLNMLFTEPIVFILSFYVAVLFGYLYLFLTTFPRVFIDQYGFSTRNTGLTYIGLGVGMLLGMAIAGKGSDILFKRLVQRNNGAMMPEYRLPPLVISAPLVAAALFWYGWTADAKTHWIVPILGTVLFGMGMMPAMISTNMYLVQAYGRYAASAVAASKVLQSIGGASLPLAGQPLFDALGLGWGNSLLAFLAMLFIPLPWILFKYGEKLRKISKPKY